MLSTNVNNIHTCTRKVSKPARNWCTLKKFRWLMFFSTVITVFSAVLLVWIYRTDRTYHLLSQYYRLTTEPKCCPGYMDPTKINAPVVAVNGTKTLLISAYLEHRTNKKQVRVIAVVMRSEKVDYRCLFYCQEQLHFSEGVSHIHADHFGFAYGTADILCFLPSDCESPSHIVVTSSAANKDHLNQRFLEVKNQQVTNSFAYNFTVCFSAMFNFTNILQLVQSLEMLQLLGVNRVVIYKTSCTPETQCILDYYTRKGLVEVIPWSLSRFLNVSHGWLPKHGPGDLHYFGQIPALNDCLYRYMYQSRYLALHDIDELILPQRVNSWIELLPLLEKMYGDNKCYKFENIVFPVLPFPASQTPPPLAGWEKVRGVNILAHMYYKPSDAETLSNFKIIVNPRVVFSTTVHGVLSSQHSCSWVDRNIARMYHTRVQDQSTVNQDQLMFDGRLLSYSTNLTHAVTTVLRETGLLPEDSIH